MIGIVLSCLLATACAAQQNYYNQPSQNQQYSGNKPNVPITSESSEISADGTFNYSYSTGDGQQAQAQGFLKNAGNKETEAEVMQGTYSYTAPDGTQITVNWIADENGFRAEGAHIPTPPPVPEAIKRSLQVISKSQQGAQQHQQSQYQQEGQYQPHKRPYQRY